MRALVTGAAGFVGSNLAITLAREGWDVVGVDSITDYYDTAIKHANATRTERAGARFVRMDAMSPEIDGYVASADVVFHQAGQPGVRKSWGSDFADYVQANIALTQFLLESVKRTGAKARFVYASSSSVYGDAETFPTKESVLPQPRSPYGVTKLAAEHLCSLYAANFDLRTVSLRYFTVYGPGQRPDMAFTRFVRAAVTNGLIEIYGDGTQVRDFTYVGDIVRANVLAALADVPGGAVINLAGGSNTSVNQVLATLETKWGHPLNVRYTDPVPGDVFRTGGDTTRAADLLGWTPEVTLSEGLDAHLAWGEESYGRRSAVAG